MRGAERAPGLSDGGGRLLAGGGRAGGVGGGRDGVPSRPPFGLLLPAAPGGRMMSPPPEEARGFRPPLPPAPGDACLPACLPPLAGRVFRRRLSESVRGEPSAGRALPPPAAGGGPRGRVKAVVLSWLPPWAARPFPAWPGLVQQHGGA